MSFITITIQKDAIPNKMVEWLLATTEMKATYKAEDLVSQWETDDGGREAVVIRPREKPPRHLRFDEDPEEGATDQQPE